MKLKHRTIGHRIITENGENENHYTFANCSPDHKKTKSGSIPCKAVDGNMIAKALRDVSIHRPTILFH